MAKKVLVVLVVFVVVMSVAFSIYLLFPPKSNLSISSDVPEFTVTYSDDRYLQSKIDQYSEKGGDRVDDIESLNVRLVPGVQDELKMTNEGGKAYMSYSSAVDSEGELTIFVNIDQSLLSSETPEDIARRIEILVLKKLYTQLSNKDDSITEFAKSESGGLKTFIHVEKN